MTTLSRWFGRSAVKVNEDALCVGGGDGERSNSNKGWKYSRESSRAAGERKWIAVT